MFAIDVTGTPWYETFTHGQGLSWTGVQSPLSAPYELALKKSGESPKKFFRVFPALPDERMKAQEGYFLGSVIPSKHEAPGVLGINPLSKAPGKEKLEKLMQNVEGPGRPVRLPFCAIVIPASVKDKLREPLRRTYNRRRRVLFSDVDGFREAYLRKQFD